MSEVVPLTSEIKPIPALPKGLQEAAVRGTLIPFVGAGASRIAGCPNWSEFADAALRYFVGLGKFSHAEHDQIKHLNPRVKLSIALSLQRTHETSIDFEKLLYPPRGTNANGRRLFASLSKLGKTFVTTNYDRWLDSEIDATIPTATADLTPMSSMLSPSRTCCFRVDELTPDNLLNRPNTVFHLHGSLNAPRDMILTTANYVQHYANDRMSGDVTKENKVLTFLETLFHQRTVLFVGYGLEELEILEYVILKARPRPQEEGPHYILQGFFSHERTLMLHLASYYRECGIQLIPFLRDDKDWNQLIDVIEDFARQAPASDPMKVQKLLDMKELLDG